MLILVNDCSLLLRLDLGLYEHCAYYKYKSVARTDIIDIVPLGTLIPPTTLVTFTTRMSRITMFTRAKTRC